MLDAIWDFFRELYDTQGINLTIFYDELDRSRFMKGIWTTIHLSFVCIVLSTLIGIIGAWLQGSKLIWIRRIVQGYIQFFRNTPPLIQLYFFYFAVDATLSSFFNLKGAILDNYGWAIISLSFFAGAFNVEIFRAGIEAVATSTTEAAEALGFNRLQVYLYVTLPLAFRACLPSLNSNLVNLIKATTIAYAIAVPETIYVSNQIWSDEYNVIEMMNVVWFVYIFLVGMLVWLMHHWETSIKIPGYGQ